MEKTPLQMALEAHVEVLALVEGHLNDAAISFEEFSGAGIRRELKQAGEALARAEHSVKLALALIPHGSEDGRVEP